MTSLRFQTEQGVDLRVDERGLEATLDNEYAGWRVTWADERDAPLYVRYNDTAVELSRKDGWHVLPSRATKRTRTGVGVGTITLFSDASALKPLFPWLRVMPANMSEADFRAIVNDLRTLAFELSVYTAVTAEARASAFQSRGSIPLLEQWMHRGDRALECASTYLEQRSLIERNPAKQLVVQMQACRRDRGHGPAVARYLARAPESRRTVHVPFLTETTETPESVFLRHVARNLRTDLLALSEAIAVRTAALVDARRERSSATAHAVQGATGFQRIVQRRVASVDEAIRLTESLRSMLDRLPAGDDAPSTLGAPRYTNRLLYSKEYGPVVQAWADYLSRDDGSTQAGEIPEVSERSVHNTPILYERWVTVRIYTGLVERGFVPPEGERSLLDRLEIGDSTLKLHKGPALELVHTLGGHSLRLSIHHDRYIPHLNISPDLVIEATHLGNTQTWVFDAKYKDYALPAPAYQRDQATEYGSHFRADLAGVAEHKYRLPVDAAVAGIVHPDGRAEHIYWDDQLTAPDRPTASASPHSLLAIRLLPGDQCEHELTKLFRLLFAYHLGLHSVCWRCGVEGLAVDAGAAGALGAVFQCPTCTSLWVQHRCGRCKTQILGFGEASFHRPAPGQPWQVHCPRCDRVDDTSHLGSPSDSD